MLNNLIFSTDFGGTKLLELFLPTAFECFSLQQLTRYVSHCVSTFNIRYLVIQTLGDFTFLCTLLLR